jgi:hypothetical protein
VESWKGTVHTSFDGQKKTVMHTYLDGLHYLDSWATVLEQVTLSWQLGDILEQVTLSWQLGEIPEWITFCN